MIPTAWVDKIFEKLTLIYGRDFTIRYENLPIAEIKQEWANCLAGFRDYPEAIRFALENSPESKPPSMLEFRALCRNAPRISHPALEAPKASEEIVSREMAQIAASAVNREGDGREWARKLKARHDSGEALNPYQIFCYRKALAEAA